MTVATASLAHAIIDKRLLSDSTLSWAARGVGAYLSTHPEGSHHLMIHLQHAPSAEREELENALDELEAAGHISWRNRAASL